MSDRHVEPVTVEECYETGVPSWYSSNGLRFRWYSWVLCEVKLFAGNGLHRVICTNFRADNYRSPGPARELTVTRWCPSAEDREHQERVSVVNYYYWKPIAVLLLEPQQLT